MGAHAWLASARQQQKVKRDAAHLVICMMMLLILSEGLGENAKGRHKMNTCGNGISRAQTVQQVMELQQACKPVAPVITLEQAAQEAHHRRLIGGLGALQLQDGVLLQAFVQSALLGEQAAT